MVGRAKVRYLHGPRAVTVAHRRLRPSLSRSLSPFLPLSKWIELWIDVFDVKTVSERSQKQ